MVLFLEYKRYNFKDDNSNILYEKKYDEVINYIKNREAYLFYNILNDKNNFFFRIYKECISTISNNIYITL